MFARFQLCKTIQLGLARRRCRRRRCLAIGLRFFCRFGFGLFRLSCGFLFFFGSLLGFKTRRMSKSFSSNIQNTI
jgi:hypothetical protein